MNTDKWIEHFSKVLHEYTRPKCGQCYVPYMCCGEQHCNEAQAYALREYGIDLSNLRTTNRVPFLGPNGCVVPPHLKPICVVYVCESGQDERYLRLRNILSYLLYRRGRDNPNSTILINVLNGYT